MRPARLKFTGPVLADIYLGKIKSWNDKAIADLNPGVKLPADPITVVRRSDGSGTTFNWTDYLSKVSPEWKDKVGSATAVAWPEGVGGKGNEGVAAYVQRIKGSIGYVEYAYAKKNNMTYALVQNKEGQYPKPDNDTFQAAAAYADWKNAPGYYQIITNSPGKNSWPIAATSFILMHVKQDKPQNARRGAEVLRLGVQERPEDGGRARLRSAARGPGRPDRGFVEGPDQGSVRARRSGSRRGTRPAQVRWLRVPRRPDAPARSDLDAASRPRRARGNRRG